jgi:hypothetical protein
MVDKPNTSEVRDAFSAVPNSNVEEIDADGTVAQITVSDKQAGNFFQTLRTSGFDFDAKRLGSRLVAHVEVEEEEGLGSLFG